MYFPYLYGKAAEVLAIRELASGLGNPQVIWPIVEPTKPSPQLKITLNELRTCGAGVYLVVNPSRGDLTSAASAASWRAELASEIADAALVRPTFLIDGASTRAELTAFAAANTGRPVGVIVATNDVSPADLAAALSGATFVAFLGHQSNRPAYEAALGVGHTVDVEDNFMPQARNADYGGSDPQGTNHLTWTGAGKGGFSDYTILPAAYSDSGGPMGALAIHLTYETPAELRLQHFVSTTVSQATPLAPKFAEAIGELDRQIAATPGRFRTSPGIDNYLAMHVTGVYTSAEKNKRLQIIHHLFTLGKALGI